MNRFTLLFIGLACCLVANAQSGHRPQVPVLNAAWPATSAKSETVRDAKATGLLRDVMVEFPEVVPTILPAILIDGMPVTTQVTNLGSEAVSGKVTLSLGGNEVATGDFIDLAAGDSVLLQMTMAAGEDVALGKTTLDATAELSDGEDEDVSDNTASEKVTVSDGEFAYDHTNASMYVDNNALGLPNYKHSLYANSFYVPNTVMLDAVSVGYGRIEGDKVGAIPQLLPKAIIRSASRFISTLTIRAPAVAFMNMSWPSPFVLSRDIIWWASLLQDGALPPI